MKKITQTLLLLSGAFLWTGCSNMKTIKHLPYPETHRGDVVDNYFGTEVKDPYRWLEDDNSDSTKMWVKAQNAVTEDYLSQIPFRDAIRNRLTQLWNYAKESAPYQHGDWWYYSYNDGLQNQSVLYRTKDLKDKGEVFLDPNTLSEDGTAAIITSSFSEDGRYYAYALAQSGSDWVDIYVMDAQTKKLTSDKISWVKFSGASWAADNQSFYYSAYDAPKEGVYSEQNRLMKVYLHKLGDPQSKDKLIYSDPQHPLRYLSGFSSDDDKWLFIHATDGTSGAEILYRKHNEKKFKVLLPGFDFDYDVIDCKEDWLYYVTNKNASNYELRKLNLNNPTEDKVLIPQHERNTLTNVNTAGGYLFAEYLKDAQSLVLQYDLQGKLIREVELPAIGSAGGFSAEDDATEFYYALTNYTSPSTSYHFDIKTGKSTLYKQADLKFNPEDYVTEQVFYPSKDGTKIPMFISHHKDMRLTGENPCWLTAYGGFQISLTPAFNPAAILFMEQGGVYCVANLRGGGEYGEQWHKDGMLEKKQNVFDDFICAAEYLIQEKYTSSSKLAIWGGSNGGLLIGACEVQRPDLFAVCLPAVGVMDMLRYHLFTIGWGWAVEYGLSENEDEFRYIFPYSPLHNIRQGVKYPATLVTTADHDDRVVPAHSFKFTSEMQYCQAGDAPILIRIESNAGHGAGKPTSKRIDEYTDVYAFLFQNIGVPYRPVEE